jgi:hypothetical protein
MTLVIDRFIKEVEDVFKGPIFAQLSASCIILCMTCFILASPIDNPVAFGSMIAYLLCMINQILLFCWIGNELIFSVSKDEKTAELPLEINLFCSQMNCQNVHIIQTSKNLIDQQQKL